VRGQRVRSRLSILSPTPARARPTRNSRIRSLEACAHDRCDLGQRPMSRGRLPRTTQVCRVSYAVFAGGRRFSLKTAVSRSKPVFPGVFSGGLPQPNFV
jgi:hypothetical protein